MRYVNRLLFAAAIVVGSSAVGLAQQGGGGGGGGLGGGGLGGGGLGGGGMGGLGGGGLGGGSIGGQGAMQGAALTAMETAPQITAPSVTTGTGASGSADPVLGSFYANPYYAGTWANSKAKANPGGFGQPLFGTTGGGGGLGGMATGGATGIRTGATGARTGMTNTFGGGQLGGGQFGGLNTAANQNGQVIALPAQIAYPAFPSFPTPPVAAPQIQADVSGMIGRSVGTIANPAGIQVSANGGTVMLRGTVRDADEARLVEGMVRLTPGVLDVRNELTFPAGPPSAPPAPAGAVAPAGFPSPGAVRLPGATVGTLALPSR
jgi:hypothetical protein